jgi:hypothetical protein
MDANRTPRAAAPPLKRTASATRPPTLRSRVGNGKTLIAGADLNSAEYREYRDIVADLVAHVGGEPTATQQAVIEELADLLFKSRRMRSVLNAEVDTAQRCTLSNTIRRLAADLSYTRIPRDVTPTLAAYLASKPAAASVGAVSAHARTVDASATETRASGPLDSIASAS